MSKYAILFLLSLLLLPTSVRAAERTTLYLIGDSTVRNNTRGQMGWGSVIGDLFDTNRVAISNRALGGRSSRTFLTEGLWDKVLAELKPGDFVLIQFGHNDNGPMDEGRARASIKGNSDETRVITNKTTGVVETVKSYGAYLRHYITTAREKGATPVVLSLVPRNIWKEDRVLRATADFSAWAADAARQGGATFIDLNAIVADRYDKLGREPVAALFEGDHTHTNDKGARVNAECVAEGIRQKVPALASFLLPAAPRAYIFSYFVGNGEDGLHLAWSRDAYTWKALNGGKSFLKPEVGESKLVRDPCLLHGPDGKFHMVWTTAWNGKTIGYAWSSNLVDWSEQKAIPVMAHEPAALNCWAPEVFWDARKQEYLIFWATTVTNKFLETAGQSESKYNHRMYATTTRDFDSFTPAKLFYNPGFNVIDATLLPAFGKFFMVIKDETVHPPMKHLRTTHAPTPTGPYTDLSPPFTPSWVEGPTWLDLGGEFIVYFDKYREHAYGAMVSKDLVNWIDVTSRLSMPKGLRHGTTLPVAPELLESLLKSHP